MYNNISGYVFHNFLYSLQPYELMNLADALERKYFSDGTCIIKQGNSADAFYIVEEGTVKITKDDPVSYVELTQQFNPLPS